MSTQEQTIQQLIAKEFGFEDINDQKQKELIGKMTESVIKRVLVDAYIKLGDAEKTRFEDMMENIDDIAPEEIDQFFQKHLTDYESIVHNAVIELKQHIAQSTEIN